MGEVTDIAVARARIKKKVSTRESPDIDDSGPMYAGNLVKHIETEETAGISYGLVVDSPCPEEVSVIVLVDDPLAIISVSPNTQEYGEGMFILRLRMNKPIEQHIVRVFPEINGVEFSLYVNPLTMDNEDDIVPYCEWYMEELLGVEKLTDE